MRLTARQFKTIKFRLVTSVIVPACLIVFIWYAPTLLAAIGLPLTAIGFPVGRNDIGLKGD